MPTGGAAGLPVAPLTAPRRVTTPAGTATVTAVGTLAARGSPRLPRPIGRTLRRGRERIVLGGTGRARGTRGTGGTTGPGRPRLPGPLGGVLALARRRGRGAPLAQQERRKAEAAVRHQECVFPLVIRRCRYGGYGGYGGCGGWCGSRIGSRVGCRYGGDTAAVDSAVNRSVSTASTASAEHGAERAGSGGGFGWYGMSCHFVNAPHTGRVPDRLPGPAPGRRYLPATPPSHGGRRVCRYRC
jgi:hypothetical protein